MLSVTGSLLAASSLNMSLVEDPVGTATTILSSGLILSMPFLADGALRGVQSVWGILAHGPDDQGDIAQDTTVSDVAGETHEASGPLA